MIKRWVQAAVLDAIVVSAIWTAAPARAQKVKITYDKSTDFPHYKRYAWAKNYLITRQRADDQKAIGESLKSSIDRQLGAKGFALDAEHPDFLVSYEAGGMSKAELSTVPNLSYDIGNPNALNQPAPIGPVMTNTDRGLSSLVGSESPSRILLPRRICGSVRLPRRSKTLRNFLPILT